MPHEDGLRTPKERDAMRVLRPFLFVLMVIIPGCLAFWLLGVHARDDDFKPSFYISDGYTIYRCVVAGLVTAAAAAMLLTLRPLRNMKQQYSGANVAGLAPVYALYVVVAASLPLIGSSLSQPVLQSLDLRVSAIVVIVHAMLWPVVCLPWMVRHRVSEMRRASLSNPSTTTGRQIAELLELVRVLTASLAALAVVISLAVIAAGQFTTADNDFLKNPASTNASATVLYGFFYAAILATFYVPAYLGWQNHARRLRDATYAIPADGRPDTAWADGRKRLSDLLQLDRGVLGSLGPTFSILLPAFAGFFSYFVPSG
jgi:hypothetical protein